MKESMRKGFQQYEQMLLDATRYTGNSQAGVHRFSASMLGDDLLQNYYKYMYGSKESKQFEANTFGSLYQLGVDKACEKNDQYLSGPRYSFTLDNGWEISGEIDQMDMINKIIFDNKVTTMTTIKKIRKEGKWHQYALQLGVYKWLLSKITKDEWMTALPVVDKGFSYFNDKSLNQIEYIEIETFEPDEIEKMLYERTNLLDEHIEAEEVPGECANLFFFKNKSGKTKKMRCIHYCDYSANCEYYNDRQQLNDMLGL